MASKRKPAAPDVPPATISILKDRPFTCRGLREDNPRDFLAALGWLRLLDRCYPRHGLALAWSDEGHPIYHVARDLPPSCLADPVALLQGLNAETPHPFAHHKVIRVAQDAFRAAVRRSLHRRDRDPAPDPLPAALYAAYGSQIHDAEKGDINPTAFSFSNGQAGKELLRDISELIARELSPAQLAGDLTGDPAARKDAKSFRWHPAEYRAAAYRAPDPGGNVKGDLSLDHPSFNILAFFGLTFYPVVDRTAREATTGFSRRKSAQGSADFFTWPIWSFPLDPDSLASMLHHPALHLELPDAHTLRGIGCRRAWSSRRFSADKSLYFSPAGQVL